MNKESPDSTITPDTTVGALLELYPPLEDVLIEMIPAFSKLRNPVMRRTVAKVATLRQVARVGQLDLSVLINRLRKESGVQGEIKVDTESPDRRETPPEWFDRALVSIKLDAREMIEAGDHPIRRVLQDLQSLKQGRIFELTTAFVPSPLIDIVQDKGYKSWSCKESPDIVRSYFIIK
jgi:uncharacterized protein (DUF2249 family)